MKELKQSGKPVNDSVELCREVSPRMETLQRRAAILDGFVQRAELVRILGISERTLQRYDESRAGPPRIPVGHQTWYRVESVREWLIARETAGPIRRR